MNKLIIYVAQIGSQVPKDSTRAEFTRKGGAIGRDDRKCTLMLPDADHKISRIHAEVIWRANGFFLVARSQNPTLINGTLVYPNEEYPLHVDDAIEIGEYRLKVETPEGEAIRIVDDKPEDVIPPDWDPFGKDARPSVGPRVRDIHDDPRDSFPELKRRLSSGPKSPIEDLLPGSNSPSSGLDGVVASSGGQISDGTGGHDDVFPLPIVQRSAEQLREPPVIPQGTLIISGARVSGEPPPHRK